MLFTDQREASPRRSNRSWRWVVMGSLGSIVVLAAACSSSASSPTSTVLKQRVTSSRTAAAVVSAAPAGALGTVLVDHSGLTLYRFSPDGTGKSTCTGACAMIWPPLTVPTPRVAAGSGITASELGTITRPDGTLQVTFNGMPLYRFSGDKKAGDTTGQGVAGEWFAVPAAASAAPTTTSPPATSSVPPSSPTTVPHAVMPVPAATAPPASAPPVTAPPPTAPPPTAPPATSPPPTSAPTTPAGGGGYGY